MEIDAPIIVSVAITQCLRINIAAFLVITDADGHGLNQIGFVQMEHP